MLILDLSAAAAQKSLRYGMGHDSGWAPHGPGQHQWLLPLGGNIEESKILSPLLETAQVSILPSWGYHRRKLGWSFLPLTPQFVRLGAQGCS